MRSRSPPGQQMAIQKVCPHTPIQIFKTEAEADADASNSRGSNCNGTYSFAAGCCRVIERVRAWVPLVTLPYTSLSSTR